MYIVVYVDDLLMIADSVSKIESVAKQLSTQFKLKEIGNISYYLGCRIIRNRYQKKLWILQDGYIDQLASRFARELEGRQHVTVPIPTTAKLRLADSSHGYTATKHNQHLYKQVIGSMLACSMQVILGLTSCTLLDYYQGFCRIL